MNEVLSDNSYKRNVAYKFRIGQLLAGEQMYDGERMKCVALHGKEVVRVNIVANVIDKYLQDGEKKYGSVTIDDASGQIRLKAFGDEVAEFDKLEQGDTLMIVGLLRSWNQELYITPEIMRKVDPRYLLIRKLETDIAAPKQLDRATVAQLKDNLIEKLKAAEEQGGIDVDKLIMELKESPEAINSEIKKLLEDGIAYEPRPGKLRYLG